MSARRTRRFSPVALMVAAALSMGSASVMADDAAPAAPSAAPAPAAPAMPQLTPEQMKLMQDFQKTRQELDGIEQKLQALEAKAFDKNPKLGKERDGVAFTAAGHIVTRQQQARALRCGAILYRGKQLRCRTRTQRLQATQIERDSVVEER